MLLVDKERIYWNKIYSSFRGDRLSVWRGKPTPFFVDKVAFLKSQGVKRVLDAGCGDGRNLKPFVKAGFDIFGVDISDVALNTCISRYRNNPQIHFKQLMLEDLAISLGPASFDLVICDFVLAHMKNVEHIIGNFHTVLKSGGFALLEFTSVKDPHCGQGRKLRGRQYIQHGVYLRFYTLGEIKKILRNFNILSIDAVMYSDPPHGSGYHRRTRHHHHSYFVFAKKD